MAVQNFDFLLNSIQNRESENKQSELENLSSPIMSLFASDCVFERNTVLEDFPTSNVIEINQDKFVFSNFVKSERGVWAG